VRQISLTPPSRLEADASSEVSRLQNSIARLGQTQDELRLIIADDPEADDDGELGKALQENDETM
jgi:hypothetical protein